MLHNGSNVVPNLGQLASLPIGWDMLQEHCQKYSDNGVELEFMQLSLYKE